MALAEGFRRLSILIGISSAVAFFFFVAATERKTEGMLWLILVLLSVGAGIVGWGVTRLVGWVVNGS